jgi:carboxylate-amine ligase
VDHAFGTGRPFTVGVEEELLLVDPGTLALSPVAERILPALEAPPGLVAHEAYAAELELRSPVCAHAGEAGEALARVRAAARAAGATLMGVGIHPDAQLGDAPLVRAERYRRVDQAMRGLIRRTPECALHVHVGMPDPDTAVRVANGLRRNLPLLAGLSASSPWWFGVDSGMASARWATVRAYPGRGIPPAFRDFEDYADTVASTVTAGGVDDYTYVWWDVRLHPSLGTVEVREMDAQSSLVDAAALGALVQGLARAEAEAGPPSGPAPRSEAIAWSSFRAARDGLDAVVLSPDGLLPLREAARAALARARPHAREVGGEEALAGVERILREGGGAARQRVVHAQGGMPALLRSLVQRTAEG